MDTDRIARKALPSTPREQRECRSCLGAGWVLLDAEYSPETGELVQEAVPCFICHGSGSVSVYLYVARRR